VQQNPSAGSQVSNVLHSQETQHLQAPKVGFKPALMASAGMLQVVSQLEAVQAYD